MQDNDEMLGARHPIKPAVMGFPADKVTCWMQTFECSLLRPLEYICLCTLPHPHRDTYSIIPTPRPVVNHPPRFSAISAIHTLSMTTHPTFPRNDPTRAILCTVQAKLLHSPTTKKRMDNHEKDTQTSAPCAVPGGGHGSADRLHQIRGPAAIRRRHLRRCQRQRHSHRNTRLQRLGQRVVWQRQGPGHLGRSPDRAEPDGPRQLHRHPADRAV